MTTYRTGNHWGVTIVREGERPAELDDCAFCCVSNSGCPLHPPVEDQLVAVVVNGDHVLAERICTLLNGAHTPDVDHTRGAAEALAEVRRRLNDFTGPHVRMSTIQRLLHDASAELGLAHTGGDAPPNPPSAPVSAEQPPGGGRGCAERREALSEGCEPARLTGAQERADVRQRIAEQAEHRPSSLGDGLGYGPCVGCGQLWPCTASRGEVS